MLRMGLISIKNLLDYNAFLNNNIKKRSDRKKTLKIYVLCQSRLLIFRRILVSVRKTSFLQKSHNSVKMLNMSNCLPLPTDFSHYEMQKKVP